jgi:hypothetical protein
MSYPQPVNISVVLMSSFMSDHGHDFAIRLELVSRHLLEHLSMHLLLSSVDAASSRVI